MSELSKLTEALDKAIGANADDAAVTKFIDTGYPPLNKIMSGRFDGGLPFGRMVEVFGESSTGKTALATKWMIEAQRLGGVAIFIDWERSFDQNMAANMGLNIERPYWIYLKPKTWEEGNVAASKAAKVIRESKMIADDAPIIVVFDSIAAALPKSQAEKEIDEYTMNDTTALARVTSTTLKAQAQHAEEFNATYVYLNQVRLKPGVVYGDPRTTPGGKAMEFYATARLALGRSKIMEQRDGEKEFVGQMINIQCVKSKMTAPFKDCTLRLSFDEVGMAQFDTAASLLDYLVDQGKIASSGARVTWLDGKQYFKKVLAEKIKSEGLEKELIALLAS
jgi:protein RecA